MGGGTHPHMIPALAVEVESAMRTILVGPYGLHAIGFVTVAFLLLFFWVFKLHRFLLSRDADASTTDVLAFG
jgi:hypothetical protein